MLPTTIKGPANSQEPSRRKGRRLYLDVQDLAQRGLDLAAAITGLSGISEDGTHELTTERHGLVVELIVGDLGAHVMCSIFVDTRQHDSL